MFEVGKKYLLKGGTVPGECKLITEGPYSTVVIVFDNGVVANVSPNSTNWTEYKEHVTISRYIVVWSWKDDPTHRAVLSVARESAKTEEEARDDFEGEEITIHKIIPMTATLDD